jgi:hypothetical protein
VLLVFGAPGQLKTLAGLEHGRTIPLADYGKPYLLVKLPSSWPSKQYYQGMLVRRMVHK